MLVPIKLGRAILDQVINKHGLGRHLTGFFILNEDLPPRSKRLTTMGLEATNVRVI